MKVYGQRSDGSLLISLGGGVGVIMRGGHATKATDLGMLQSRFGPWLASKETDMRKIAKQLDKCRTMALSQFSLGSMSGMSFDERRQRVEQALCQKMGIPYGGSYGPMSMSLYIPMNGMGEDWVVYCLNGKHYGLVYDMDTVSGTVTFEGTPVEVSPSWESMADRAEDAMETDTEPTGFDEAMMASKFYANYKASKKKKLMEELPGSLPNLNPKM